MPRGTPMKRASITDETPTRSEMRLPWMTRLNMSRPSWSVPRAWSQLGAWNVEVWSDAVGLWGASTSAKIATSTSATTTARPKRAVALRRSRRTPWASGVSDRSARGAGQATGVPTGSSASLTLPPPMTGGFTLSDLPSAMAPSRVADTRVQERVGQIDDQVDRDEGDRRQQGEALHLLVVAGDDGVDAEGAEARHGEQRLDHDRATDEEADLEPHDGDGRDQRVLQRVLEHHPPLAQALGARRRDVLGADHLQHAGAKEPGQQRRAPDAEGE